MAPRLLEESAGYYNRDCRACPVLRKRGRRILFPTLLQCTNKPHWRMQIVIRDRILDNAGETRHRAPMVTNEK
jgi:hypothetical protein